MDLAALRIFKAVVEHGGINRAAAKLHRVPSNITTRVRGLEEQLGTKLFVRDGRRLVLSADGRLLLTYAEQLLRLALEAETALRNGKPRGTLRIGALESTSATRSSHSSSVAASTLRRSSGSVLDGRRLNHHGPQSTVRPSRRSWPNDR